MLAQCSATLKRFVYVLRNGRVPQGSLYPALYRLEHQGLINAEWGESENKRRAKFYTLTPAGRKRLREETASWNRLVAAIASSLNATPDEV